MSNRAPDLPEVDTAVMSELRTLGQIVDYMRGQLGDDGPEPDSSGPNGRAAESTKGDEAEGTEGAERFVVKEVAASAAGFRDPRLTGKIVVTGDETGVGAALAARLTESGLDAICVAIEAVTAETNAVIYLGALTGDADESSACATSREAFHLARTVAPAMRAGDGTFITVQDTGGDFGISGGSGRAYLGGVAALAKTASIEWADSLVRAIDIERGDRDADTIAAAIADELLQGGCELEVGLAADGGRITLTAERRPRREGELLLGKDSVVVASGGGRGVTASCLIELARASQASFLLLGRTPLAEEPSAVAGIDGDANLKRALLADAKAAGRAVKPADLGRQVRGIIAGREIKGTIASIEAAGGRARYAAVSVTDRDALATELDRTRNEWGAIHGIVHGAGVLADKLIAEKTDEQFDRVFDTKIEGMRALLHCTANDDLRVICFFSSVAARVGNNGQADYAMANEILNKVAHAEAGRRDGCVVRSLGWGPWEGGMVTPALKAHFESLGVPLIAIDDGARLFVSELRDGEPDAVELVLGAEPKAAALAPGDASRSRAFDLYVDHSSHPWLADHSVRNVPVVPVVMAVEWMSRAARSWHPELQLNAVKNLRVCKGIELAGFQNGGDRFRVALSQPGDGPTTEIAAEIRGRGDVLHYTATIEMSAHGSSNDAPSVPAPKLSQFDEKIYGDVLFHGPEFQVLEGIEGIGDEGIRARINGVTTRSWGGGWSTDAAALDGGLQMALLWDKYLLGGAFLPTQIGSYRPFVSEPVEGPIEAVLTGRAEGKNKTTSDILFLAGGRPMAELRGVVTHRIPS